MSATIEDANKKLTAALCKIVKDENITVVAEISDAINDLIELRISDVRSDLEDQINRSGMYDSNY